MATEDFSPYTIEASLPPLPEQGANGYSAEQMQRYARRAVNEHQMELAAMLADYSGDIKSPSAINKPALRTFIAFFLPVVEQLQEFLVRPIRWLDDNYNEMEPDINDFLPSDVAGRIAALSPKMRGFLLQSIEQTLDVIEAEKPPAGFPKK